MRFSVRELLEVKRRTILRRKKLFERVERTSCSVICERKLWGPLLGGALCVDDCSKREILKESE